MLKQTIKRMVLTGATVMVMMSFAVPAMAANGGNATADSNGGTVDSIDSNGGTAT